MGENFAWNVEQCDWLQSATGPLPLYNVTRIPSFQSAGMWPVLQMRVKRKCRAFATGVMAYFSSSAAIPSEPGARPDCIGLITLINLFLVFSFIFFVRSMW